MVTIAIKRLIERFFPELRQRYHVPQLARIEAVHDLPTDSAQIGTWFRAHKAVDIILLDQHGREKTGNIIAQVPLAISINSHESGLLVEPQPGMQCLIQFVNGSNAMPVITNVFTIGQSIANSRSTDVTLQQSHRSKLAGSDGDWHLKTDGRIKQSSQTSDIESQIRHEKFHCREATITGHDKTSIDGNQINEIMGALKVLVGEKALITSLDNMLLGSKKEVEIKSTENMTLESLSELHAQAKKLAKVKGATVWLGDDSVNVAQVLLDLINVVKDTNDTLAKHTHPKVSVSPQAGDFNGYKSKASELSSKLAPIVE